MAIEQQRLDYEEAEKHRKAEEEAREIGQAEGAGARRGARRSRPNTTTARRRKPIKSRAVVGRTQAPGKAAGKLKQVDCLGKQARLRGRRRRPQDREAAGRRPRARSPSPATAN